MFASSPQAIEALNEMTIDGESFTPEIQAPDPPPSGPDVVAPANPGENSPDNSGVVFEVKALKDRVAVLEGKVEDAASGNPDEKGESTPEPEEIDWDS